MRHRIAGRQLNRSSAHRRAMFRNLAAALFEHGEIETTLPKAKAVQPFVEKLITVAKQGLVDGTDPKAKAQRLAARRELESRINDRRIHAWVADANVPDEKKDNPHFDLPAADDIEFNRYGELRKAPRLVQHIMTVIAPKFEDRDGGYTRIIKLGKRRLGDATNLVLLQLVGTEEGPEIGGRKSTRRQAADRRTAFAAKLRKGAAAGAVADTATAVADPVEEAPVDEAPEVTAETPDTTAEATDATQEDKKD